MPETPAHAIPGVRLEHDHGALLSGSFVLHHPLIAGRTIAWPSAGLAGVRAQTPAPWSHSVVTAAGR